MKSYPDSAKDELSGLSQSEIPDFSHDDLPGFSNGRLIRFNQGDVFVFNHDELPDSARVSYSDAVTEIAEFSCTSPPVPSGTYTDQLPWPNVFLSASLNYIKKYYF